MKITPAMIGAARGADPAFADVPDAAIRAALKAALDAAPGAKPSPALIATMSADAQSSGRSPPQPARPASAL
jgi:hypothetical protein